MKNITFILSLAIFALIASAGIAQAQESATTDVRQADTLKTQLEEKQRALLEERKMLEERRMKAEEEKNTRIDQRNETVMELEATKAERVEAQAQKTEVRQVATEERDAKMEERKVATEARAEEKRMKAEEKRKEQLAERGKRIEAYILRTGERLGAAIGRLETLSERILSRIEKFEERGADMGEARRLLGVANTSLTEARTAVSDLGLVATELVNGVTNDETPTSALQELREAIKEAVLKIKEAHAALVDVIEVLKASVEKEVSTNATDSSSDGAGDTENTETE